MMRKAIKRVLLVATMAAATFTSARAINIPRPQFERADWVNLNGQWTCELDMSKTGDQRGWKDSKGLSQKITVPFCPESQLSGIGHTDFIPCIWYQRSVSIPAEWTGKRILLQFGAADYETHVYINGKLAGEHYGTGSSFAIDLTPYAKAGEKINLVVRVDDDLRGGKQPGGKQSTQLHSAGCYYTRVTGIWQTVWMEAVDYQALKHVFAIPDIDQQQLVVRPEFYGENSSNTLTVEVLDGKKTIAKRSAKATNLSTIVLPMKNARLWSPEDPYLYDVKYTVRNAKGDIIDQVSSYVGMRKVHIQDGYFYLNNKPYFQRLVLDQGYYPDGIWTAPSDEALRHDIELSMQAGFNGARLHQKVFEERFHYWADKLGYITWGEAPSWGMDANNPEVARNFITEWSEEIIRDRNHPSIVTWTPMNEEWWPDRVQFPRFVADVYDLTKALDPSRPVCDVSGGVHVKTDIWTTHNYEQDPKKLQDIVFNGQRWFQTPNYTLSFPQRNVGFNRHTDNNLYDFPTYDKPDMPYLIDEVGGIKWVKGQDAQTGNDQNKSWGYGEPPHSLEEFYARLEGQIDALMEISENVWGYCYTQLTDVEQEQNGIYFYDRTSKFDMKRIHAIFSKKPAASKH